MLEEGLVEYILDGQTFDLEGVRSMRENPNHVWTSPFTSYNYHGKGNFASLVDVVVLGATEVDVQFNANVVSHSAATRHWRLAKCPFREDNHFARSVVPRPYSGHPR